MNYWSIGFQSQLYDRLSPESYFESMRRVVDVIPHKKNLSLLDIGCGSGLLLQFLEGRIREGMVYTGVDCLKTGVAEVLSRAQRLGIANRVSCFQSDLTSLLVGQKFDVVVGHFSLYVIYPDEQRLEVLSNLKTIMNPEGLLILTNPSINYDVDSIIEESINLVRNRYGFLSSLIKQILIYPLTKAIGLRFIKKQLRQGKWKAYTIEEFSREIKEAGFLVQDIEEVYAESAFLATGRLAV
jgi:SAM-dependent methyltransferase